MVNSNSINSQLDQELQCSICHDMFKDPRMLPCQHTFCLECLEKFSKLGNGITIDCSLCKRTHDLPSENGAKGFPENMLMKSLLEIKINPRASSAGSPRGECIILDDLNPTGGQNKTRINEEKIPVSDEILIHIKDFDDNMSSMNSTTVEDFKFDCFTGSFYFMWIFSLVLAVAMIIVGNKFYDDKPEFFANMPLLLLAQGTTILVVVLTPLLISLFICGQKSILARIISNIGILFFGVAIVAMVFFMFIGTVGLISIIAEGCKEENHCQMVPYLFALAFNLGFIGMMALYGLIRLCYWIVNFEVVTLK